MEIIRNGMMRNFGVDNYDEAMSVVYTTIDNEDWDWGRERMNSVWRSWREHRRVSRCYSLMLSCLWDMLSIDRAQNLRNINAGGGQGQVGLYSGRSNRCSRLTKAEKLHATCFSEASQSGSE